MTVHPLAKLAIRVGLTGAAALFGVALLSTTDGSARADDRPLSDGATAITAVTSTPATLIPDVTRPDAAIALPEPAVPDNPQPAEVPTRPAARVTAEARDALAQVATAATRRAAPALGEVVAAVTAPLLPPLPPLPVADPLQPQGPRAQPLAQPTASPAPSATSVPDPARAPMTATGAIVPADRSGPFRHQLGTAEHSTASPPRDQDTPVPASSPSSPPGSGSHCGSGGVATGALPGRCALTRFDNDPIRVDEPILPAGRTPKPTTGPA